MNAINEILKSSSDGDILLFQNGVNEIIEAVETINLNTKSNVFAMPLYSTMPNVEINKILNFDDHRQHVTNSKHEKYVEMIIDKNVKSQYTRFVIVATNIVEASITLKSLKFVIDNGFQKYSFYDINKNQTVMEKKEISEKSRLQRKGRVGRVSPGVVYYLYEQKSRIDVLQNYGITTQNLQFLFYKLLKKNGDKIIFDKSNDPNKKFVKSNVLGLDDFVKKYYFANDKFIDYYGNDLLHDYNNTVVPTTCFDGKYESSALIDTCGQFYIIHPEEPLIQRNIKGNMIRYNGKSIYDCNNVMIKTMKMIKSLLKYDVVELTDDNLIVKNEFGCNIDDVIETFVINEDDNENAIKFALCYVYSRHYKCDYFVNAISFCFACDFDLNKIVNVKRDYSQNSIDTIIACVEHINNVLVKKRLMKNDNDFTQINEYLIDDNIDFGVDVKIAKKYTIYCKNIQKKLVGVQNNLNWFEQNIKLKKHEIAKINGNKNYIIALLHGCFDNIMINVGNKYTKLFYPAKEYYKMVDKKFNKNNYEYLIVLNEGISNEISDGIGFHEKDLKFIKNKFINVI
jgi:hypothetical protein